MTTAPLEQEAGGWLLRTATVVPANERWLHALVAAQNLREALQWTSQNAPCDADLDDILSRLAKDLN